MPLVQSISVQINVTSQIHADITLKSTERRLCVVFRTPYFNLVAGSLFYLIKPHILFHSHLR